MKRCDPCGLDFEGSVSFCRACGVRLTPRPGAVSYDDLPPTARVRACARCEAPARFAWRFCARCGADLGDEGAPTPDGEEPALAVEARARHVGDTERVLASETSALGSLPGACPFCGTPTTSDHRFCERCGFEVVRCMVCKAIVPAADARYCEECGSGLGDPSQRNTLREPIPSPIPRVAPPAVAPVAQAPPASVAAPALPEPPEPEPPQVAAHSGKLAFLESYDTPSESRRSGLGWIVGIALLVLVLAAAGTGVLAWRFTNTAPEPARQSTDAEPPPTTPVAPPPGMVLVAGGEFVMGSDEGDEYERPAHRVAVAAFHMDVTEVTCDDYARFVAATGREAPPGWTGSSPPPGAGRRPVTGVTWDDAVAYAVWAGKRLPTEAEWEYAARGSDGRRFPWGDTWGPDRANAHTSTARRLTDVGSFPEGKSPFGLLDMCGNAWEWTSSDLVPYPGGRFPKPPGRDDRVIRGGCWKSDDAQASTTYRYGWPARGARDYGDTGFRCASDVSASPKEPS